MSKKTWVYVFIAIVLLIALFIFLFVKSRGKYSRLSDLVNPVKKPDTVLPPRPPSVSTGTSASQGATDWVKESFPLDFGMYGDNVRLLQRALGFSDTKGDKKHADGYFGNQTWAALSGAGYLIPISQSEFNELTGASSSIIPNILSTSDTGKDIYSKSDITAVYINDSSTNPTFLKFAKKDAYIGTVSSQDDKWYYSKGTGIKVEKSLVYLT